MTAIHEFCQDFEGKVWLKVRRHAFVFHPFHEDPIDTLQVSIIHPVMEIERDQSNQPIAHDLIAPIQVTKMIFVIKSELADECRDKGDSIAD